MEGFRTIYLYGGVATVQYRTGYSYCRRARALLGRLEYSYEYSYWCGMTGEKNPTEISIEAGASGNVHYMQINGPRISSTVCITVRRSPINPPLI